MDNRFGIGEPKEYGGLLASPPRISLLVGSPGRRCVVQRDATKYFTVIQNEVAESCLTNSRRVFENRVEYWLQLALSGTDDLEHLRGRSLLLARLGQFASQRRDSVFGIGGGGSGGAVRLPRGAALDALAGRAPRCLAPRCRAPSHR